MANIKNAVKLGVFTLAIMNVTAVVSLRGLPAEAVYGMSSAFYYLFAAIVFLIPTSLVAAELAAMFQDKQGGVFRWVGAGCPAGGAGSAGDGGGPPPGPEGAGRELRAAERPHRPARADSAGF